MPLDSGLTSFPPFGDGLRGVQGGVHDREGALWVFTDGAVYSGSHGEGGWVLEDASGTLLGVDASVYPDVQDPFLVELLALRDGIQWALEMGVQDVVFAGDAKVVLDKVKEDLFLDARGGAILSEIKVLRQCFLQSSVRFVGRARNRVTHMVARKALSLFPSLIGFDFRSCL
ncbi:unnamed protein product [Linum trigynum]|uniref:RNase H type-1 domain-containing protein n=1 Tax=Linum trigynum TaxID=586398 RepID=A0AAV2DMF1_9ROSI